MKLNKLYKKQAELDKHILEKHNIKMSKEELLDNTILALLVEVGELANTTRCFKHWSTKGMMDKEVVLDELADVLHFYLSIGNQTNIQLEEIEVDDSFEAINITTTFHRLYYWARAISSDSSWSDKVSYSSYEQLGIWIKILWCKLNFTDEEVEQAYLKKHEENYRRQEEGY